MTGWWKQGDLSKCCMFELDPVQFSGVHYNQKAKVLVDSAWSAESPDLQNQHLVWPAGSDPSINQHGTTEAGPGFISVWISSVQACCVWTDKGQWQVHGNMGNMVIISVLWMRGENLATGTNFCFMSVEYIVLCVCEISCPWIVKLHEWTNYCCFSWSIIQFVTARMWSLNRIVSMTVSEPSWSNPKILSFGLRFKYTMKGSPYLPNLYPVHQQAQPLVVLTSHVDM